MKDYVIDTSVAVKWLFREPSSPEAEELLYQFNFFYVPSLFLIEMDSVITKKVRQRKLSTDDALFKQEQVRKMPFKAIEYKTIASLAFEISISLPVTFYDACYLATGIEKNATVYTADKRLVRGISNTFLNDYIESI